MSRLHTYEVGGIAIIFGSRDDLEAWNRGDRVPCFVIAVAPCEWLDSLCADADDWSYSSAFHLSADHIHSHRIP